MNQSNPKKGLSDGTKTVIFVLVVATIILAIYVWNKRIGEERQRQEDKAVPKAQQHQPGDG